MKGNNMKETILSKEIKERIDYIFENGKKDMIYRLQDERAKREYKKGHGNYVFIASIEVASPVKLVSQYCKEKGYVGTRVDIAVPGEKKETKLKKKKTILKKLKKVDKKNAAKPIVKISTDKQKGFSICTNVSFTNIGNDLILADIELYDQEPVSILFIEKYFPPRIVGQDHSY